MHPSVAPSDITAIEGARQPDWPAPLSPEIRSLPPVTGIPVEAAARRTSPAERVTGAPLRVNLAGSTHREDLEVVVIDAATGVEYASRGLGDDAALTFGDLPAGEMTVALREARRSARFEALTVVPVTVPDTDASGVSVELPIDTYTVPVTLALTVAPDARRGTCAAITVAVRKVDDPAWRGPTATAACPGGGAEPITVELGPLGAGRYRLELSGVETTPDADLTFALPRSEPVTVEGHLAP